MQKWKVTILKIRKNIVLIVIFFIVLGVILANISNNIPFAKLLSYRIVSVTSSTSPSPETSPSSSLLPTITPTPSPTSNKPTNSAQSKPTSPKPAEPSERALKAAAGVFVNADDETKNYLRSRAGENSNDNDAIKKFALFLDSDQTKLAYVEAVLALHLAEKSKPAPYISLPPAYIPPIINSPQRCRSTLIGDTIHTDCY